MTLSSVRDMLFLKNQGVAGMALTSLIDLNGNGDYA
jgi:hypothetical protein